MHFLNFYSHANVIHELLVSASIQLPQIKVSSKEHVLFMNIKLEETFCDYFVVKTMLEMLLLDIFTVLSCPSSRPEIMSFKKCQEKWTT